MKFRTEYIPQPADQLLDPGQPVVLLGSCFTDNIGARMRDCRWEAYPNPAGTLYNPRSIANILRLALRNEESERIIEESLVNRDNLWMTWLADSSMTACDCYRTKAKISEALHNLKQYLSQASALIVTFGTAWIYELRERPDYVVSNCHKFPATTFLRRRLTVDEIIREWNALIALLRTPYPGMRIILTVSPIRHLKDGFEGNSRSKAILQLACEEICCGNEGVEYFPAFEIMNDDLRDYRFYASDMLHPSERGVDYIWEKFQERYVSDSGRRLLAEGEKVTKRLRHRQLISGD